MQSFEELEVWKSAREYRKLISELCKCLPSDERYRLGDQLIRSSRSVSANIAEGFGRFHFQENIQFCRQARGSLYESLEHLLCGYDEGYIDIGKLESLRVTHERTLKLINGYIAYLKRAKEKTSKPGKSTNTPDSDMNQ